MAKIICVVGTRPEAIKMAPVVRELRQYSNSVDTLLVSTGQHREMLAQSLAAFGLAADHDLDIMQHGQTLAEVTAKVLMGLDRLIHEIAPAFIIGQGDTTTCFGASLAAFYRSIPFAHVEAGLRTKTVADPFPEEFNRRAASLTACLHFAPTHWAAENLLKECVPPGDIFITGNTGIDAVLECESQSHFGEIGPSQRLILLTTHRRENWGEPQKRIARAALKLVEGNEDTVLVVAMHRNPKVRETLTSILRHPRIHLIEPPEYPSFVGLLKRSTLILTDSGGVQEEAPAFGVPVLVLRETTERPEGVSAGTAILVGTDEARIISEAEKLLSNHEAYEDISRRVSPYGDGQAAKRIRYQLLQRLGIDSTNPGMWTALK